MPPKVKMIPVNEIAKLIREHNKLSKIEMPKGKDRTRPNLIKAIEDAGFKLNHEKKRIEKGAEKGSRVKTDPKKDATKDPKKVVIDKSKKPPMASMKIKPKASKPKNMKQLKDQVKDILKPVPARVKQYKKEGASLKSLKQLQSLKRKYMKPYRDAFSRLLDSVEEEEWLTDDRFEEINNFFYDILDKGFDNAQDELMSEIVEVKFKDIATKRLVRLNNMEELKKYWKDFKDKYMNQASPDGVGGSLREKYANWIAENEKTSMKEMEMQLKGKGGSVDKPKLELKKPVPKKVEIDKDKKPPLNTMKIKKDFDKEFIKIHIAEMKEHIKNLGGSDMDVINEQRKRYNQLYKKLFTDFKVKFNGDILEEKKEETIKTNPTLKKLQAEFSKKAKKILDEGTKKKYNNLTKWGETLSSMKLTDIKKSINRLLTTENPFGYTYDLADLKNEVFKLANGNIENQIVQTYIKEKLKVNSIEYTKLFRNKSNGDKDVQQDIDKLIGNTIKDMK